MAHDAPCYRCLYPQPPPAYTVTNCSDGGVLGMVPGVIGQIQAIEVVKLILGVDRDNLLCQRMIFFDAMTMKFRNVKLRNKNPDCVACGLKKFDLKTFDYAAFCGTNCQMYAHIPAENNITAEKFAELQKSLDKAASILIDVRPKVQFDIVNAGHSKVFDGL